LEDLSELRELPDLEGGVDEAAGEEADGFPSVEAVTDGGPLDGNHSDDRREYFGRNAGFRRETCADYRSMRLAVLLFTPGVDYLALFF